MDYEMGCGCQYIDHGFDASSTGINFCPLHTAASELLKAAKLAKSILHTAQIPGNWWWPARDDLDATITKADGD